MFPQSTSNKYSQYVLKAPKVKGNLYAECVSWMCLLLFNQEGPCFFSLFLPISPTWPLSWRDYNIQSISYLFHVLITIVYFFVILHDLG